MKAKTLLLIIIALQCYMIALLQKDIDSEWGLAAIFFGLLGFFLSLQETYYDILFWWKSRKRKTPVI